VNRMTHKCDRHAGRKAFHKHRARIYSTKILRFCLPPVETSPFPSSECLFCPLSIQFADSNLVGERVDRTRIESKVRLLRSLHTRVSYFAHDLDQLSGNVPGSISSSCVRCEARSLIIRAIRSLFDDSVTLARPTIASSNLGSSCAPHGKSAPVPVRFLPSIRKSFFRRLVAIFNYRRTDRFYLSLIVLSTMTALLLISISLLDVNSIF